MSAEAYWFDDIGTFSLELDNSATAIPIAGAEDVSVVPNQSIEQLFTADSIKISEQKAHEFMVDVDIGFMKWDPDLIRQWLDTSAASDGTGDPVTKADTSNPTKFSFTTDFTSVGGGVTYEATVGGITFEEMPFLDASRGDYVQTDLSGVGETISFEEL